MFGLFKKKKISLDSANFARLVKQFCAESGIPIPMQLKITKAIARDFIDAKSKSINDFFFMDDASAKSYIKSAGLNDLDAEIFWSIMKFNSASFLQAY